MGGAGGSLTVGIGNPKKPFSEVKEFADVEEYLRGVVPCEMPALWPIEALKAQAVCARTYAYVAKGKPRHLGRAVHLCNTTHCQVWRNRFHPQTDKAIAETDGLVLWYIGGERARPAGSAGSADSGEVIGSAVPRMQSGPARLAQAFYSARCGGQTKPAWNPKAAPWCRPVSCQCVTQPMADPARTQYQIAASHGVGLCQYGAMAMAMDGAGFQQILLHYFSGVVVMWHGWALGGEEGFPKG